MGKKRPVIPFPAAAGEPEDPPPRHFSDYGFDPQLSPPDQLKRQPAARRHQQPPLESARFKLQKPISKRRNHHKQRTNKQQQQQRRWWWSSAASAALLFFKRPGPTSSDPAAGAATFCSSHSTAAGPALQARPLYFADGGDDDDAAACACWAPAMRSGRLAAAELGAASAVVPYVSLIRDVNLGGGGAGAPPAMPIYLVT